MTIKGQMSLWFGVAVSVAFIFFAIIRLLILPISHAGLSQQEMQKKIHMSLPMGSQKDKVIRFLNKNKILYDQAENKIYAGIQNTCYSLLMECSLGVVFKFDAQERLVSVVVTQNLTGP